MDTTQEAIEQSIDKFPTALSEDQRGLEEVIKELLHEARQGNITGVAIVIGHSDGDTGNFIYLKDKQSPVQIIGELGLLERDLIDCYCQTRRQPAWEFCE